MSSTNPNLMLGAYAPTQTPPSSGAFNPPGNSLPGPVTDTNAKSWFEAMAKAWGTALDSQAAKITELSDQISNGGQDQPSTLTLLTTASLQMQFLATNASTSNNSVGQALETLGRKQ